MGEVAAKKGDFITATDIHLEKVGYTIVPIPNPFRGILERELSPSVFIMDKPAAVVGSIAVNTPKHSPKAGSFVRPPNNEGTIITGSSSVRINNKPAARNNDGAVTCTDVGYTSTPKVVAYGTVYMGN